jgi:hypothetical protein
VRGVLRTPLPEVYSWSSRAEETLVGAGFILMEKINGVELERFLPHMKIQDRLEVVKAIAGYQKSWASVSFEQFGSLCFFDDIDGSASQMLRYIDQEGRKVQDSRFVVGPSTGREMFDDGRASIKFDWGPCKCSAHLRSSYLTPSRAFAGRLPYCNRQKRDCKRTTHPTTPTISYNFTGSWSLSTNTREETTRP